MKGVGGPDADPEEGGSYLWGFVPATRQEPELEDGEGSEKSEMGEKVQGARQEMEMEEGQDAPGAEGEVMPEWRGLAESPSSASPLSLRTSRGFNRHSDHFRIPF